MYCGPTYIDTTRLQVIVIPGVTLPTPIPTMASRFFEIIERDKPICPASCRWFDRFRTWEPLQIVAQSIFIRSVWSRLTLHVSAAQKRFLKRRAFVQKLMES